MRSGSTVSPRFNHFSSSWTGTLEKWINCVSMVQPLLFILNRHTWEVDQLCLHGSTTSLHLEPAHMRSSSTVSPWFNHFASSWTGILEKWINCVSMVQLLLIKSSPRTTFSEELLLIENKYATHFQLLSHLRSQSRTSNSK